MKTKLTTDLVYVAVGLLFALAIAWQPSSDWQQFSPQPMFRLREADMWGTVIDGRAVIPMGTTLVKLDRGDVVPLSTKANLIPGERVNLKHYVQPIQQHKERQ
jgi:hypothetical protein